MKKLFLAFIILFFFGCEGEEESNDGNNDFDNHPNMIYVGNWNFKVNNFSYSGYYIYDSLMNSEWISNTNFTTDYNDSTGSIQLGGNDNELIFKYCDSCPPVLYNLNNNSVMDYNPSYGANSGWVLTDSTFFNIVIPPPPSYSTSYTTLDIEGWKLE